jgi:Zn-finger nucleic acid-binding protein
MNKVLIGPVKGVMIDRCTRGHGLWFDGGELDGIVKALQTPVGNGELQGEKQGQVGNFLKDVLLGEKDSS